MKGIDILNTFLIVLILYYLLTNKKSIEKFDESNVKCLSDNDNTSVDCTLYPLEYKTDVVNINQCSDGGSSCTEKDKIKNCCNMRTDVCQGNIDGTKDIICQDGSWPKVDSDQIPYECKGLDSDQDNCWMYGKPDLRTLPEEEQQSICCTSRNDFLLAEQYWGIPYLISKASKIYDDSKLLRNDGSIDEADDALNRSLKLLYDARELDVTNRYSNIINMVIDWGNESGYILGENMCIGNIDKTKDIDCSETNQKLIDNPFIKEGNHTEICCIISGMCKGNTNSAEDIICPDGMTSLTKKGSTIDDCCKGRITCRGNPNVNLNFNCPSPLIPVLDSENVVGNTKEECCRHPDEREESELKYTSTNETITGTLLINADFLQVAGLEGSEKRELFINNFKKDIIDHINSNNKVIILENQINVKKIYKGSIVVDFEIVPNIETKVSITKEYLSYLLSNDTLLPTIGYKTGGGITNLRVISWYNLNNWPQWIWYVIVITITSIILLITLI